MGPDCGSAETPDWRSECSPGLGMRLALGQRACGLALLACRWESEGLGIGRLVLASLHFGQV